MVRFSTSQQRQLNGHSHVLLVANSTVLHVNEYAYDDVHCLALWLLSQRKE